MGNPTAEFLCVAEQGGVWAALGRSWHAFEASPPNLSSACGRIVRGTFFLDEVKSALSAGAG
jgi:hypothetical protein